jgi:hypothetical protein
MFHSRQSSVAHNNRDRSKSPVRDERDDSASKSRQRERTLSNFDVKIQTTEVVIQSFVSEENDFYETKSFSPNIRKPTFKYVNTPVRIP